MLLKLIVSERHTSIAQLYNGLPYSQYSDFHDEIIIDESQKETRDVVTIVCMNIEAIGRLLPITSP